MDPDGQLRNLRDFLLVYNRMTEICFQRCTSNFNYRNLTMDEERCAESCAGKLIRTNHRLMGTYVQMMPAMVQKRMQEMESKAAEVAKAEAAAAQGGASAMIDTQSVPISTPGIPPELTPLEILETPQIASTPNYPSEIKPPPLVLEPATQASETAKLGTGVSVTQNAKSFTTDSLQGQITVPAVMSTSSSSSVSSPEAGVDSVSSAVLGAGQNSQTPS
ncbi:Mitochondrial import inner membrane translocase subunit [Triplophysa tibetana]|uniref:Mitochondrial import inner membrane translocase subunit Tim10 B n=1 Tax=Triplophysa tibetana TaxID=1572043 RepID=A0A5A9N5Y7_9TELE|nr:Mitochondrial import inner membrane translocase subunit [Triplophysa tibetana]